MKKLRLNRLKLTNFKCFDEIEIDFKKPVMKMDPDILVMGSKNGMGKTSILEACCLLPYLIKFPMVHLDHRYFIKSGKDKTEIYADIEFDNQITNLEGFLASDGTSGINHRQGNKFFSEIVPIFEDKNMQKILQKEKPSLFSQSFDPFVVPFFLYFHSNRKVKEGTVNLSDLISGNGQFEKELYKTSSEFKLETIRSQMAEKEMFENVDVKEASGIIKDLNKLTKEYAQVEFGKLNISQKDAMELKVKPLDNNTLSYSFDALSSGQKELISTLFLITKHTKNRPSIVMIDEPELHLNAEWQNLYIHTLHKLAPQNQYIIATHSEQVFSSVESEYRAIITPDLNVKEVQNNG